MLANKMATNSQPYNCLTVVKQNCGSDRKRFAMLANKMATQSQTYKSNTDEAWELRGFKWIQKKTISSVSQQHGNAATSVQV